MSALTVFDVELRAEVSKRRLTGHAAVFGPYAEMPGHREVIGRNAFDRVLADDTTDVRALVNHNPGQVLGRQKAGTLELRTDSTGLEFVVPDLPQTTYADDLLELVRRGDVSGASFGFIPGEDEWSRRDGIRTRTHTDVRRLVDVSVVTFPAYEGAGVALRSEPRPTSDRIRLLRARARVLAGRK